MKKSKRLIAILAFICVAAAMIPLMTIYPRAGVSSISYSYCLYTQPGTYDSGLQLTVASAISTPAWGGEPVNACPKAILVSGNEITTKDELVAFLEETAARVNEETETFTFDEDGNIIGVSENNARMLAKYMLMDMGKISEPSDEALEAYISTDRSGTIRTLTTNDGGNPEIAYAAMKKGSWHLWVDGMEPLLYDNGPVVADDYIHYFLEERGHGPEYNIADKTITFELQQYEYPVDYHLFVLNSKDIISNVEEDRMQTDDISVYDYTIKGKGKAPGVNLPYGDSEVYTSALNVTPIPADEYADADIYYTLDGTDPRKGGIHYDGTPIKIEGGLPGIEEQTVLKIYSAGNEDHAASDVAEYTYCIQLPKVPGPAVEASVPSGTYDRDQKVRLDSIAEYEDVDIYYTTDGSDPAVSETAAKYEGGEILVSSGSVREADVVLKVCSVGKDHYCAGAVSQYTYHIVKTKTTAPAPEADVVSGIYDEDLMVSLSCGNNPAEEPDIRYTLDGSDPLTSDTAVKYDGKAISISGKGEIKKQIVLKAAVKGKELYYDSSVAVYRYTMIRKTEKAPAPVADLPSGTYSEKKVIKLSVADTEHEALDICYTLDGSDPRDMENAVIYNGEDIVLDGDPGVNGKLVLRACAMGKEHYSSSEISEYTYRIAIPRLKTAAPVPEQAPGSYTNSISLKLSCEKGTYEEIGMLYTLDGSDPASSATAQRYTEAGIALTGVATEKKTYTVKAVAIGTRNYCAGEVMEATYVIDMTWLKKEVIEFSADGKTSVSLNMVVAESVTYNGKTHVISGNKASKSQTADVWVKYEGDILTYATPVYKVRNSLNVAKNQKKRAYFTLRFRAVKGADADQKKAVKALNKELKKKKFYFDVAAARLDESNTTITVKENDKFVVTYTTPDGRKVKLKKKDFTVETGDGRTTINGKGNFSGSVSL